MKQGIKVETQGRQNERNSSYVRLAHTSLFGLCFMLVCLLKSICYSLVYSSLIPTNSILQKMSLHQGYQHPSRNSEHRFVWTCSRDEIHKLVEEVDHENSWTGWRHHCSCCHWSWSSNMGPRTSSGESQVGMNKMLIHIIE